MIRHIRSTLTYSNQFSVGDTRSSILKSPKCVLTLGDTRSSILKSLEWVLTVYKFKFDQPHFSTITCGPIRCLWGLTSVELLPRFERDLTSVEVWMGLFRIFV